MTKKAQKPRHFRDDQLRIAIQQRGIERAQRRTRRYLKPGDSLVHELLAERHEAGKKEQEFSSIPPRSLH